MESTGGTSKKGRIVLDTLKWAATVALIIGFGLFSAGVEWGFWLQITGGILWLVAGYYMKDKPIMCVNLCMTLAGLLGRFVI